MAKHLILILLSIILISCAARKTDINKVDSVVKIDSTSVAKKETVTTQDNHISVTTNTDELEIVPIDTSKCIEVDGKKYKNVKLKYKKTKKVLVDTTKIKVSEKASIEVNVKKDTSVKTFKKEIDKKTNYSIYLWWLLVLLLIGIGFYMYKKINKTLF
jgi:ATP-dependent Zn protease